jgi:predicted RNase H-like HicB family nuclease
MNKKYAIKIWWSDEDDCYCAEVPALRGCVSHGYTPEQAAGNIQEAMELWLETAGKYGHEIPQSDIVFEEIYRLSPVLNVSKLARLAKVNRNTLVTKLRRRSAFTQSETRRLLRVVKSF